MPRSSSSRRWLQRQHRDQYTSQAKKEGYRSRAAYKLLEINSRDKIITKGMRVVDLGAAPGGWSQVAANIVGEKGFVAALDILSFDPIPGVNILQGDFTEDEVYHKLEKCLDGKHIDVVISDMAPNFTGIRDIDVSRAVYLCEVALDFALQVLAPGGSFVVKVFQGCGFEEYLKLLRSNFKSVVTRKPNSSRQESKEVYLVAKKLDKKVAHE